MNKIHFKQQTVAREISWPFSTYKENKIPPNGRDDSQERRGPLDNNVALDEDSLRDILYRSLCMLRIGETISNLSKHNSFNFRDLGFMDEVYKTLHASGSEENEGGEHQRRLDAVLNSYSFIRCPVQGLATSFWPHRVYDYDGYCTQKYC